MAARNSGIPAPVREDVTKTSGKAAGCLASAATVSAVRCSSSAGFHLVGLGEHDLVAHG